MFLRITTVDEKLFPSPVSGRGRGEKIGRAGLLASHRPGYAVASSSSAAGALSTKLPISAHLLAVTRMVTDPGIIWSERALLKWFHLLSSRNEFFLFSHRRRSIASSLSPRENGCSKSQVPPRLRMRSQRYRWSRLRLLSSPVERRVQVLEEPEHSRPIVFESHPSLQIHRSRMVLLAQSKYKRESIASGAS